MRGDRNTFSNGVLSTPLEKRSVVNLVINRIKEAITRKEIKPGSYLPSEADLAQSLGVGKSSVREALKMLEAMGVVEIRQGSGTYIPLHPSYDSISPLMFQLLLEQASTENLIELRMIFEPAYSQLAMKNATYDDLAILKKRMLDMEEKVARGEQVAEDDLKFHETILGFTHNPLIIHIGKTIHELFKQSVASSMRNIPQTAIKDHRRIYEALVSRNPEKLQEAMMESYKGWMENLDD